MADEQSAPSEAAPDPSDADVGVEAAELPEAEEAQASCPGGQIDLLLGATMSVSASLGQMEMSVGDLLQLGPGAVVQLDRLAGEPVDLLLRGVKFATGALVVVGDRLGVKIRQILPPAERGKEAGQ